MGGYVTDGHLSPPAANDAGTAVQNEGAKNCGRGERARTAGSRRKAKEQK